MCDCVCLCVMCDCVCLCVTPRHFMYLTSSIALLLFKMVIG